MELSDFSDFTRVIIIDDKEDEGRKIQEALEKANVSSLFCHVVSNRSLNKKLCKNARIVFLDLIFSDSGSSNAAQAGNAISKLSKIIGKTGFYILVLWSSHTTEDVAIVFRQQLERQNFFAKPHTILTLQKNNFKTARGNYNINAIIEKINEQLLSNPSLKIFLEWEKLANNSISEIAGNVVGQKNGDILAKTVNSLSGAYAGNCRSEDNPKNALMAFNEIFQDTLSRQIICNDFGNLHTQIGTEVLDADDVERAKLNTCLMFTPDTSIGPGSIFKIKQAKAEKKQFIAQILDQQNEAVLKDAYKKIIPIAIEVTPLCNAAQNNGKNSYFLNGLMHPAFFTNDKGIKREITVSRDKKPHCYMINKGFLNDNGETFKLSFNLKLFHSNKSDQYILIGKKLRDSLVIDLQHQVSSYISRPGHVLL